MAVAHPSALVPNADPAAAALERASVVRLPEAVYRRRRAAVAMIAAAAVTALLAVGRPDRVPPGEANPWPTRGEVSLPAELPGVYVVQPGDTLWDIALAVTPGADPRAVVQELAEAAGGAALEPGQEIVVDVGAAATVASDPDRRPAQPGAAEAAGSDR